MAYAVAAISKNIHLASIRESVSGRKPRPRTKRKSQSGGASGRMPTSASHAAKGSGIVVLDVDTPRHGGDESLAFLEEKHSAVARYATMVLTGGGGTHYFFKHPGVKVPNSAGRVGPGIDIRGDGGYVLVPRSNHASGRQYEWEVATKIGMLPLAERFPDWLRLAIVDKARGIEIDPGRRQARGARTAPRSAAEDCWAGCGKQGWVRRRFMRH